MKNFGLLLVTWLGTNMLLFCGLHCGVPSSLFLTTIFVLVLWHKTLTQLKIDSFILHCLMPQRRSFNMRVGLVSTPSTCVLSSTHGLPSSSPIKSPPNGREVLALRNGRFENIAFSNKAKYYFASHKQIFAFSSNLCSSCIFPRCNIFATG